ncbi:MAG: glycine--tRNA ligase subunit beta [Pseudomonadota bacterium]
MPELLLELFCEEIPARMQAKATADLRRLVLAGLADSGLAVEGDAEAAALAFSTPRRLTLVIPDLPAGSPRKVDERRGPRTDAPAKAIEGFLRSAGLSDVGEAQTAEDAKGRAYYIARIEKPGRDTPAILADVIPDVITKFPWPKSMRWGDGDLTWVRPLQSILCLFDGTIVTFTIGGMTSGNTTEGHRFLGEGRFAVASFEDYGRKLQAHHVLLPASERSGKIEEEARSLADAAGLTLVDDQALLSENAGITEWPTVLMGSFDEAFLDVPAEVLMTAMKTHQKYFSLRTPADGKLANRFLLVTNLIATDGGASIIAGNERVIAARLSDAAFFWAQDLKVPLDEMASRLNAITFHERLGSQQARVDRIADLAHDIAGRVDADADDARRAAQLAKADLVSGMVGEFPELQGLMGRYYASAAGTKPEIARAIELHYKPKGPTDAVPLEAEGDAVAVAVALADKLDTLAGFWAIDEKPTGSKDPFALRRAALGVVRIVLENEVRLPIRSTAQLGNFKVGDAFADVNELAAFFADRLKVYMRDAGARHDLIDAIYALGGQDDLALVVRRVEALDAFLATPDGANLLAGIKRAANILTIEETKDKRRYDQGVDAGLLRDDAERTLADAIAKVRDDTVKAIDLENFKGAMNALAELRGPVDAFFEAVTVNADDPATRANRLAMLSEIRAATATVADFSKVAG